MEAPVKNALRFIGRQAILDVGMNLYGYELLFRSGANNAFSGDGEDATNQVIDSCVSMIACSSSKNIFINCTRESLVRMSVKLLPSRNTVLELLETVSPDPELMRACNHLKALGFRFAMDDFSPQESKRELFEIADYIKVDFRASDAETRQEIYRMCRRSKPIFLAEKVETHAEVETAKEEGNTLFQGYFHSRPEIIAEAEISVNKAAYLQLFGALAEPTLEFRKIEYLILQEPSLCYRLLRLANSALYGFRHQVSTIQGALFAVGEDSFRKLVTVTLAGKLSHGGTDMDVRQALERAHFCESLASMLAENPAELYMLGMLSRMDRMLNIPMNQLVALLYLGSATQEALLGSPEGIGMALELCRAHEQGGDIEGRPDANPLIGESTLRYFNAMLATGRTMRLFSSK
jgi:EAL and modified HD-GYP domain-containing signal transduction protein